MSNKRFYSYTNKYDQSKKEELVKLGQGPKNYKDILIYLQTEIARSTQITSFNYQILCFREDGAYQLNKAIEEVYGASINKGDKTPSNGEKPVEMIDVKLSDGSRIKVPFGRIDTPDLGKGSYIDISYNMDNNNLYVNGTCEFRFASIIDEIINKTQTLLNSDSIYKNQAFELTDTFVPKPINLDNIDKEFMILNETTEFDLQPLKSRILHPEKCIEKGIPLKYGCLLEGPYGTGKTLLAFKLAADAIKNGWSFVYLKDPTLLAQTLKLSRVLDNNGHGVIVFVEDIDQVTRGNRDTAMQDILNTLDGGDTKNMNVIALFTTNHIELIEPTFLRGKRIGSVISLGFLDAHTASEFLKFSFKPEEYQLDEDLEDVCQYIERNNIAPAFMAEIVESIKSKMIYTESTVIKKEYIKGSVDGYLRQVALSQKKDMSKSDEQLFSESFARIAVGKTINRMVKNTTAEVLLKGQMISDTTYIEITKEDKQA